MVQFHKTLLASAVILAFLVGFGHGLITYRYRLPPWHALSNAWAWTRALLPQSASEPTPVDMDRFRALAALGYVSETEAFSGPTGVIRHDKASAYQGFNLYCSGHGSEARLLDMNGREVHRWYIDMRKVWPDFDEETNLAGRGWRKVWLLPDGDLLAINSNLGLVRLDSRSRIKWKVQALVHHDLSVDRNGNIYTLMRTAHLIPRINAEQDSIEDLVVVLDPEGREKKRVSILQAFEQSRYAALLKRSDPGGDLMHVNAVKILEPDDQPSTSPFQRGRVLISSRTMDTVAVLDLEAERIEWALTGLWSMQHEPMLLDSGSLLVFDNRHHDYSRVVEIDPLTQRVLWQYRGDEANGFASGCCGSSRRLPNGNTLITHSVMARAFEVNPKGEIVWEFRSPHRIQRQGREITPYLFEVTRHSGDAVAAWLRSD